MNLLTIADISKELKISITTIWRYLSDEYRNPLKHSFMGERPIVTRKEFLRWCKSELKYIESNPDGRRHLKVATLKNVICLSGKKRTDKVIK